MSILKFQRVDVFQAPKLLSTLPCRCLDTASIVLADMPVTNINTEELIRETLGSDTCDARRSVSDPPGGGKPETGPCAFDRGLKSKYPQYNFPGMPGHAFVADSTEVVHSCFCLAHWLMSTYDMPTQVLPVHLVGGLSRLMLVCSVISGQQGAWCVHCCLSAFCTLGLASQ